MATLRRPTTDESTEVLLTAGPKALARRRHISLRTLRRRFVAFGTTLSEYVQARRAALVLNILQRPGVRLRDATRILGFSSDAALTRFVKREFGKTPGELRGELADEQTRAEGGSASADPPPRDP